MRHSYDCNYSVEVEDEDGKALGRSSNSYRLLVQESLEDIFEFEFQKKYDKTYSPLNWFLEPNSILLYKDLENKWLRNEIDTYKYYYNNEEFKDYLLKKHMHEISGCLESKVIDELRHLYPHREYLGYTIHGDNECIWIEGEIIQ